MTRILRAPILIPLILGTGLAIGGYLFWQSFGARLKRRVALARVVKLRR